MFFIHRIVLFATIFAAAWCSGCPGSWNSDGSSSPICYNQMQCASCDCKSGCDIQTAISICKNVQSTLPYFYTDDEFQKYKDLAKNYYGDQSFWIGLYCNQTECDDQDYKWLDGNPRYVAQWKGSAPNNLYSKPCVSTKASNNDQKWVPVACTSTARVVCQSRQRTGPCPFGFFDDGSGKSCYQFQSSKMTAQLAQDTCNTRAATSNLPIFSDPNEYISFLQLATRYLDGSFNLWIGLSRTCVAPPKDKASFNWIDGSEVAYVDKWAGGQPNDNGNSGQACVTTDHSSWNDAACDNTNSVVCQYRFAQPTTVIPFTAPICPRNQVLSYCPLGWSQSSLSPQLCFFFVTYQNTIWQDASDICKNRMSNSTLPILKSSADMSALINLTGLCSNDTHQYTWLGMTNNNTNIRWVDNTVISSSNTHWHSGEPGDGTKYQCGRTYPVQNNMAWAIRNCTDTDSSLITCQLTLTTTAVSTATTCAYIPQPGYQSSCPNYLTTPDNRVWTFYSNTLTWMDAFGDCNKKGGRLVQPVNKADTDALANLTQKATIWIGAASLNEPNQPEWYNTATVSTNLNVLFWPNQVPIYTNENLYYATSQGNCLNFDGITFNPVDCNGKYAYVCEKAPTSCDDYIVLNSKDINTCDGGDTFVTCHDSFYLNGTNPRICILDGDNNYVWTTSKQQCISYCQPIPSINNGTLQYSPIGGPYDVNSTATVSCTTGYYPVPKDGVKCTSSGDWETALQCLSTCELLPDPTNGHVFISDSIANPGTNATFTCDLPYYLTGPSVLVCEQDRNWNGTSPTCETFCPALSAPDNGEISSNDFSEGTILTFTCNKNYNLIGGDSVLLCQNNRTWNGTYPPRCASPCDIIVCPDGSTCIIQDSGQPICQCPYGYYGSDCDQINFCMFGDFSNHPPQQQRKKRQIGDTLPLPLDSVIANFSNITSGAIAIADALLTDVVDLASLTLDALSNTVQQFNLPSALPGTDACAPNGICISGSFSAACICKSNYYGSLCGQFNCSTPQINWTAVAKLSPWSECYVIDCAKELGVRNRTFSEYGDCPPPTEQESCIPDDCIPPDPLSPTARVIATVAQSVGCTVILTLLGTTLGLFFVFRIMSLERMLHMFQEISLFAGHVAKMVIMKLHLNKKNCAVVGMFLQLTFLTNFTFLALEALQTYCVLQQVLSFGGFFSWKINAVIGLGFPFGVTLLTASTMFGSYKSPYSCWLNYGKKIAFATVVPLLFLCLSTIILTEAAAMGDKKKLPLTSHHIFTAAHVSQKGSVLIMTFNILSWLFGTWALYAQKVEIYGLVLIFDIVLGVVIFLFHTLSNDQVHQFLKSKIGKKT